MADRGRREFHCVSIPTFSPARSPDSRTSSSDSASQPTIYIIAGPVGTGKTSFSTTFPPDFIECRELLNADLIAAELSPFAPEWQFWKQLASCWTA